MLTYADEGGSQSLLLSVGPLLGLTGAPPSCGAVREERTQLQSLLLPRMVAGPLVEAGVSEESIGQQGWVREMKKRHERLADDASPPPPQPAVVQTRRRLEPCLPTVSTPAGLTKVVDFKPRLGLTVPALSRAAFVDLVKGDASSTPAVRPQSAFPRSHDGSSTQDVRGRVTFSDACHGSGSSTLAVRPQSAFPKSHDGSSTQDERGRPALPNAYHGSSTQDVRRRSSLPTTYHESIDKYKVPPPVRSKVRRSFRPTVL